MKKSKIRNALFAVLILVSLGSFVYVNSVQLTLENSKSDVTKEIEIEEDQTDMVLPEVQLVKKLLEKGKEILPATRF